MMSAAQIEPFQPGQVPAELFFKDGEGLHQRGGILFTQGVEMQTFHAFGQGLRQVTQADAQAAARGAGVIDGMTFLGGMFRIDSQTHAGTAVLPDSAVSFQLGQGVEADVVTDFDQLLHLFRRIGRAEHMVFLAGHLLVCQAGLIQAAGGSTGQILADERIHPEHGKGFLGQQDMASGTLLYSLQNGQVMHQCSLVHHIHRGTQPRFLVCNMLHHSTVAGASSTTQGRPYWLSISMNGSGSISSRLCTPALRH